MDNLQLQQIFADLHGSINPDKQFVPLKNPELEKYLGVDGKYLFLNKEGILDKYFYFDGLFLTVLQSDKVQQLKFIINKRFNLGDSIKHSAEHFKSIKDEKKFVELFSMIDKKILFYLFNKLYNEIPDNQKWDTYREAHIRAENGFDMVNPDILKDLLNNQYLKSKERTNNMRKLRKYGKELTIFHGHNKGFNPKDDISWTLNKKTALFFANRFGNDGEISEKKIRTSEVVDYFNNRHEQEIILKIKNK